MRAILIFGLLLTVSLSFSSADADSSNSTDSALEAQLSEEVISDVFQTVLADLVEFRNNVSEQITLAQTSANTVVLLAIDEQLSRSQRIITSVAATWQDLRAYVSFEKEKQVLRLLERLERWATEVLEALTEEQVDQKTLNEYKLLFNEIVRIHRDRLQACQESSETIALKYEDELATLLRKYVNVLLTLSENVENCAINENAETLAACQSELLPKISELKQLNRELRVLIKPPAIKERGECVRQIVVRLKYAKREIQRSLKELIEQLIEEAKKNGVTDPSADINLSDYNNRDSESDTDSRSETDSDSDRSIESDGSNDYVYKIQEEEILDDLDETIQQILNSNQSVSSHESSDSEEVL